MGKWTSVKERLPEEHEETRDIFDMGTLSIVNCEVYKTSDPVIVTVKNHEDDEIFVSGDCITDGEWSNFNGAYEVIAWQPLPEPYNAEDKEESIDGK